MLESFPVSVLVGTVLGTLSGLGVGGGSLLILWLTLVLGMDPGAARGINLLFFLPAAAVACVFRARQGALPWKAVIPAAVGGCAAGAVCARLAVGMDLELLKKGFGILLLVTGLRELCFRPKK